MQNEDPLYTSTAESAEVNCGGESEVYNCPVTVSVPLIISTESGSDREYTVYSIYRPVWQRNLALCLDSDWVQLSSEQLVHLVSNLHSLIMQTQHVDNHLLYTARLHTHTDHRD